MSEAGTLNGVYKRDTTRMYAVRVLEGDRKESNPSFSFIWISK